MREIPCEVVRDLFPSYIENLTSETTNEVIGEHLEGCEACRQVLASMKDQTVAEESSKPEKKEIDFLKKNRRKNHLVLLGSLAGALLLILAVLGLRTYVIGQGHDTNLAAINLNVTGKNMDFLAVSQYDGRTVVGLSYQEEDGVVRVEGRTVVGSPLHSSSPYAGSFMASEEIREVRFGDRIVWSEGATVSALASDLFAQRHNYIGDMPANNRLSVALNLGSYLGPFTNELETSAEPYGWKLLLSEDIPEEKYAQKHQDMIAFGRILVALVGNLDHVTFVHTVDGAETQVTVDAEAATQFFGEDIKNCGKDIRALDRLIEKSGFQLYAFPEMKGVEQAGLVLRIQNQSDTMFQAFSYAAYHDGEMKHSGGMTHADNTPMKIGEVIYVDGMFDDPFGADSWPQEAEEGALYEMGFGFETPEGTYYEIPERIRLTPFESGEAHFVITGTAASGYHIVVE